MSEKLIGSREISGKVQLSHATVVGTVLFTYGASARNVVDMGW